MVEQVVVVQQAEQEEDEMRREGALERTNLTSMGLGVVVGAGVPAPGARPRRKAESTVHLSR